jgi:hypothetical protein
MGLSELSSSAAGPADTPDQGLSIIDVEGG